MIILYLDKNYMEQNLRKMISSLPKLFGKHKQWTILQILFLVLTIHSANAESYYIVNPNAKFGRYIPKASCQTLGITEWLKLTPVEGTSSKYTILLPAYYPSKKIGTIDEFISNMQTEKGFSFVVATKTQIDELADQGSNGNEIDVPDEIKNNFLAPAKSNSTDRSYDSDDKNYWVSDNIMSGALGKFGSNDGCEWEIRKIIPSKKYEGSNFQTITNVCGGKFLQLTDDLRFDGAFRLTIDVSTMSWTMEYVDDTRVGYLAMSPTGWDRYRADVTYTFAQSKNAEGKYSNVFYNSCVYLRGTECKLNFISNVTPSSPTNSQKVGNSFTSTTLDDAMLDAIEDFSPYQVSTFGADKDKKEIKVDNSNNKTVWGHVLSYGSDAGSSSLTEKGSYFSVKWYPYVTSENNVGIIKIGDGDDASADMPKFSAVWLRKSTEDSEGNKDYKLSYDENKELYYIEGFKHFTNDKFYFQGKRVNGTKDVDNMDWGNNDMKWSQDGDIPTSAPNSEVNADYLMQIQGTDKFNKIEYSENYGKIANGESVNIYFKIGTADDGVTPTYKYWVSRPTIDQTVNINYLLGEHIRTYSNSLPYDIKDNSNVKIYVVKSFAANAESDKDDGTSTGNKTTVATATLKQISYIPAYTGVILLNNTDNTTNTDPITVTLTPHTVTGKETAVGTNYLVPTLCEQYVNASLMKQHVRVARNFFLGSRGECTDLTEGQTITDYIGFFRAKNYTLCHENYAYLQIPVSYVEQYILLTGKDDLNFDTASGAKGINFVFEDLDDNTDVTGVSEITVNDTTSDDSYYTLSGIKVQSPTHGLYIHCGKKLYLK